MKIYPLLKAGGKIKKGNKMKIYLIILILLSILACNSNNKYIIKKEGIYIEKSNPICKDSIRIYFNKKILNIEDANINKLECILYFSSTDQEVKKRYATKILEVENNDSLIYTDFVIPSEINDMNIYLINQITNQSVNVLFHINNINNKIYHCQDIDKVVNCQNIDSINMFNKKEKEIFPYNNHYLLYTFYLYKRNGIGTDTIREILNRIEENSKMIPPQTITDKIDYYSFMAMSNAFLCDYEKSEYYLKILQSNDYKNSNPKGSALILNLGKIPLFYLISPNSDKLNIEQKKLLIETLKTAISINSFELFIRLYKLFPNNNISKENTEFSENILQYYYNNIVNAFKENDCNKKNIIFEWFTFDDMFKDDENVIQLKKLGLNELKSNLKKDKYSKDTNDYYLDKKSVIGLSSTIYADIVSHYFRKDATDSIKLYYYDAENNIGYYSDSHSNMRYLCMIMKDLFIKKEMPDSATYYLKKAFNYEYFESKYFKDEFDKVNNLRKKSNLEELNYNDFISDIKPMIEKIESKGEIPKEINYFLNAKDTIIFFININEDCKLCNSEAINFANILKNKYINKSKVKYCFITDLPSSEIIRLYSVNCLCVKRNEKLMSYLRFDKRSQNITIYKNKEFRYLEDVITDESFIETIVNK